MFLQGRFRVINWIIIIVVIAGLIISFIVLTDGRYFGKWLVFWIYDRFGAAMFGGRSEAIRWQRLAGLLALRGDERMLDVGTAVGDLPLSFAAQPDFHGHAVGLDWSPQMMVVARQAAQQRGLSQRVSFVRGDARRPLPFACESFNVIICLETLETLPHPEQILSETLRILRPDGRLVFSVYRGILVHSVSLSLDWYEKQLKPLGFNLQRVELRQNCDIVIGKKIED